MMFNGQYHKESTVFVLVTMIEVPTLSFPCYIATSPDSALPRIRNETPSRPVANALPGKVSSGHSRAVRGTVDVQSAG